jgi:hypothetical protein
MTTLEELEALRRLDELEAKMRAQAPSPPSALESLKEPLGFALESGKAIARGAGKMVTGMGQSLVDLAATRLTGKPMGGNPLVRSADKQIDQMLPEQEGLYFRGMEGVGGGLLGGGPRAMLPGAAGAVAGGAADKYLENQNPVVRKIASLLANVGVAGLTGAGLGGAKPPEEIGVKRDVGTLTNIGLDRIGPRVDVNAVANRAADAATGAEKNAANLRTQGFSNRLSGETLRGTDTASMYRELLQLAERAGTDSQAQAYREIAASLVRNTSRGQRLITDLPSLSTSIKNFRDNPPGQNASTGSLIGAKEREIAFKDAQALLEARSVPFSEANKDYSAFSSQVVTPMKEGAIGRMADNSRVGADPTPVGRLTSLVSGNTPETVISTVRQLASPLNGAPVNPVEIARAIAQKKLESGPVRPDQALFGGNGSAQEEQIAALLTAAGRNVEGNSPQRLTSLGGVPDNQPRGVRPPLQAADTLASSLPAPKGPGEIVSVNPSGVSARGFFRPEWLFGNPQSAEAKAQVQALMANASPEELAQLRRLAMFDPSLRAALSSQAAITSVLMNREKE